MDLYLTEKDTGWRLSFCLLPDSIKVSTNGNFISYNLVDIGEAKLPSGQKLRTFSWNGTLPGEAVKEYSFIKTSLYHTPKEMINVLERYRKSGTKLILMLTETDINVECYLSKFSYDWSGGVGNVEYSIEFTEAKDVVVYTLEEANATQSNLSSNRPSGTRASSKTDTTTNTEQTKTYTVKSGDCLWSIAQAQLGSGSKYSEIYELNKDTIGSDPSVISVGQTLVLPY